MHRFFAPGLDPGDEQVTLPREEGEHLTRVLRLGAGDTIAVFDGRGREFLGRVVSPGRRDVRVQLIAPLETTAEPAVRITLAPAVLKGEKMDEVVRDAVMLGVAAIQPIVTTRSEVTVAALVRAGRVERWQRVALASVKQSRRAFVPEVRPPLTLEGALDEPPSRLRVMLVEPGMGARAESLSVLRGGSPPDDAVVYVGPEGGWTDEECVLAHTRGVRLVTLGHRTLRADAVPVAAISVLLFLWGDW